MKNSLQPVNVISTIVPITDKQKNALDLYQKEWITIIETQMHFNDLILRFRGIVITVFLATTGAITTLAKIKDMNLKTMLLLLVIPSLLWVSAFLLDYFYYQKLLIAAVAQAKKYDNNIALKAYGLYGLTTCIENNVSINVSNILIISFYLSPLLIGGLLIICLG